VTSTRTRLPRQRTASPDIDLVEAERRQDSSATSATTVRTDHTPPVHTRRVSITPSGTRSAAKDHKQRRMHRDRKAELRELRQDLSGQMSEIVIRVTCPLPSMG
jgi:hypothetical protein